MIKVLNKNDTITRKVLVDMINYPPPGKSLDRVHISRNHAAEIITWQPTPIAVPERFTLLGVIFHLHDKDYTVFTYA